MPAHLLAIFLLIAPATHGQEIPLGAPLSIGGGALGSHTIAPRCPKGHEPVMLATGKLKCAADIRDPLPDVPLPTPAPRKAKR